MSLTFKEMIKAWKEPSPGNNKKYEDNRKCIIIPPRYENLIFMFQRRGIRVSKIHGLIAVEASKGLVNSTLKGMGFKVIGFVKLPNGERYKFIGKAFKVVKKKDKSSYIPPWRYCKKCRKPTLIGKCSFCGGNDFHRARKRIKTKNYRSIMKEQRRCVRSILNSFQSKGSDSNVVVNGSQTN